MKIEKKKTSQLEFDPKNARKHSETNIKAIASSLKEFGQRKPIVVTTENVVIAGNGTLEAAKSLGWSDIDVTVVPKDWNEERLKAFALADNRTAELAHWDASELLDQLSEINNFEMSDFGFDLSEYEELDTSYSEAESRGLGTPIIHYDIIFEDENQQSVWFAFIKKLRIDFPEQETLAGRLTQYLGRNMK